MKSILLNLLVVVGVLAVAASQQVVLAQSIGFDPASGTFTNDFTVDVTVDTDTDSIAGVAVDVSYNANRVSFSGYDNGTVPCDPLTVTNDSDNGVVSVNCLIDLGAPNNGSFTGTGSLAQLQFKPVGNGSLTLSVSVTDDGGVTYTTSDGAYTISGVGSGNLPSTGEGLWNRVLLVGMLLIALGVVWIWQGRQWLAFIMGNRWFEQRIAQRL